MKYLTLLLSLTLLAACAKEESPPSTPHEIKKKQVILSELAQSIQSYYVEVYTEINQDLLKAPYLNGPVEKNKAVGWMLSVRFNSKKMNWKNRKGKEETQVNFYFEPRSNSKSLKLIYVYDGIIRDRRGTTDQLSDFGDVTANASCIDDACEVVEFQLVGQNIQWQNQSLLIRDLHAENFHFEKESFHYYLEGDIRDLSEFFNRPNMVRGNDAVVSIFNFSEIEEIPNAINLDFQNIYTYDLYFDPSSMSYRFKTLKSLTFLYKNLENSRGVVTFHRDVRSNRSMTRQRTNIVPNFYLTKNDEELRINIMAKNVLREKDGKLGYIFSLPQLSKMYHLDAIKNIKEK